MEPQESDYISWGKMNYTCIVESLLSKQYESAEELSINAIKQNRFDAQLWLYLAESLAFQGYGASAMAVFNRAWILDPVATWIEKAKKDLILSDMTRSKEEIDKLLIVNNVSVTAALIVKNESEHIENCLGRIVNYVDEIIIVDTGSTDDTIEKSKKFSKVKIIDFKWCEDFAAARNAAFPYISSDWVIWIDADEYMYEEDSEVIKEVAGIFNDLASPIQIRVGIMCQNDDDSIFGNYSVPRMFRMKDDFRFFGRVHEQVVFEGKNIYEKGDTFSRAVRIRFIHQGYKLSVIQKKLDRNILLLKKMVDEIPDDPAWLFFYGRELFSARRFEESMEVLLECERLSSRYPNFGRLLDVYTILAKIYINKIDYNMAESFCKKALGEKNDFPDALYLLATIYIEKGFELNKTAEEFVLKSKMSFESNCGLVCLDPSISEWKADMLLGDIALYQGRVTEAANLYQKVLKVSPLKEQILKKIELIYSNLEER